jgi:hypothetical protein
MLTLYFTSSATFTAIAEFRRLEYGKSLLAIGANNYLSEPKALTTLVN